MTQDVFTALADPTRRALLEELSVGERAVGELVSAVEASQPTVSKHLRVLRESGLVHQRAVGQKRFYRIETGVLLEAAEALRELAGVGAGGSAQSASPRGTAEKAAAAEPGHSTEPVQIVSAEAARAHEGTAAQAPAEPVLPPQQSPAAQHMPVPEESVAADTETVVGEASLETGPAAQPSAEPAADAVEAPAQEALPQRLDPLSAVQDDQVPARGRGVSGLVSSVLRRRRR